MSRVVGSGVAAASVVGDRRAPTKGERQRRAILDALAGLLENRSIGDVSVNEIASAAGVNRSGFYFYFDSKFAPLAVLASEIWSNLAERTESFGRRDNEPVDDYLDRLQAATAGEWVSHSAVLIASIQAIPHDPQLAEMWRARNAYLADVLTQQVLKDQHQGLGAPASSDVSGLVATLLEMTTHLFYLDRLQKCTADQTARSFGALRAIWLAALWGQTPPAAATGEEPTAEG